MYISSENPKFAASLNNMQTDSASLNKVIESSIKRIISLFSFWIFLRKKIIYTLSKLEKKLLLKKTNDF